MATDYNPHFVELFIPKENSKPNIKAKEMSKGQIELESGLIGIFTSPELNDFTVSHIRSAYLSLPENINLSSDQAQRVVYRQILKLKNKGLLKRIDSNKGKKTTYVKTELFSEAKFKPKEDLGKTSTVVSKNRTKIDNKKLEGLIDKLETSKLEMLTRLGESNGCKSLYDEYPEMKETLQKKYNKAREESAMLLGYVKLLESLIERERETTQ